MPCLNVAPGGQNIAHPWIGMDADRAKRYHSALSFAASKKVRSKGHNEAIGAALTGLHWFNNGLVNTRCAVCPDGFIPGFKPRAVPRSIAGYRAQSEKMAGRHFYNDGVTCVSARSCPPGFSAGRLGDFSGRHWFNNGVLESYGATCPSGFTPGRLNGAPYLRNTKVSTSVGGI